MEYLLYPLNRLIIAFCLDWMLHGTLAHYAHGEFCLFQLSDHPSCEPIHHLQNKANVHVLTLHFTSLKQVKHDIAGHEIVTVGRMDHNHSATVPLPVTLVIGSRDPVIYTSLNALRSTWLASDLQPMPIWHTLSLLGYRHLKKMYSAPGTSLCAMVG